jgi:hypothetical protein
VLAWRALAPALDREVAGWKEINRDSRWVAWLHSLDSPTRLPRQRLLDDAVARKDVGGVVALFRGFAFQYGRATVHKQVQSRTTTTRGKPIYSRADILHAHQAYMKGAYRGREAEYEALQAEFQRASAEGRIVGALPLRSTGAVSSRSFGLPTPLMTKAPTL